MRQFEHCLDLFTAFETTYGISNRIWENNL
jgi:hypothetical protein